MHHELLIGLVLQVLLELARDEVPYLAMTPTSSAQATVSMHLLLHMQHNGQRLPSVTLRHIAMTCLTTCLAKESGERHMEDDCCL